MSASLISGRARKMRQSATALAGWRGSCGVALAMAGCLAGAHQAAAAEPFDISLNVTPTILSTIRVLSPNGELYNLLADNEITLDYDLSGEVNGPQIDLTVPEAHAWGLYWGECEGQGCFTEGGNTLLDSSGLPIQDYYDFERGRQITFPSTAVGATPSFPIGQSNDGMAIVQLCNDWVAGGGDITIGTTFVYPAKATLGLDIVFGQMPAGGSFDQAVNAPPYSYPPTFVPEDIDQTETIIFPIWVTCEAYHEPPSAGAPAGVAGALPPMQLESVQLFRSYSAPGVPSGDTEPTHVPQQYSGDCPVNVDLDMLVETNIRGPIWVWLEHSDDKGNNWTSDPVEFETAQPTEQGTWKWTRQDPLLVPIGAEQPPPPPAIPIVKGGSFAVGGGGTGGEGAGGGAATAFETGYEGDPNQHVGQIELHAGIGRNVVDLLGGGGGQAVVFGQVLSSGPKVYNVTCEPKRSTVAGSAPTGVQTEVYIEESFLATVPQATADGSSCGVWTNGWVRTNVGNVPITLRLRNQAGVLSDDQTITTSADTRTAYLMEYFDFSGSGEGVWVQPGGGWSMPGASDVGNQEGVHQGSYQMVVESPVGHDSNVAAYNFTCQALVALQHPELASPTPQEPERASPVGQPAGELTTEPRTLPSLDVPPIISLVLDDDSSGPQQSYVNVPLGQDGFWNDGYSGTVSWGLQVGAVTNPALAGVGTQWTTIELEVGPWGNGAIAMTPQLLSLSDPPDHVDVQATYVSAYMSSGDNTPDTLCNALRQNLLDQGQSLAGVLGNTHIIDVEDVGLPQPRAQLNAALAYDQNEDPYYESAVAVLPLKIRCLGNPAIAEQFLPGDNAPDGIATPEDFTIISADLSIALGGQPASEPAVYEGTCSVDGTVEVTIAANLSGAAQYQVLYLSEANELTAMGLNAIAVDKFNEGGYWEFSASITLGFPFEDAVLPGFSTEPGGFVTENFSVPAAGSLIGNNADDPNEHTGFFRVLASPLGVPEPTADSLWKKYRVTCDQGEGGIGEVAGTGSGTPPPRPSGDLATEPRTLPSLDVPPIISLVLDDDSSGPQQSYVNVPLGQDGFWNDGYSGTVSWGLLVGAVTNPALAGVGTQWTTIELKVGPWGNGAVAMTPQVLSLSDPPDHVDVQATYVSDYMSSGDNTPDALCNALRQNLLDQGQSLAGVLGNTHIIDVDDVGLPIPRVQLDAALAYDQNEDPYYESAVAALPLKIRCLGNPAIAEQFLPSDSAPGGIVTPEEFSIISAGLSISLGGQPPSEPATYEGACSVEGTVDVKIAANLSGAAQYQVLHLSEANELTVSDLTAIAVDDFNEGGYWEFNWSQTIDFPIADGVLPGFSTEPGGFVTEDFSVPAAGSLIGNNINDPNEHTGFFRVMASPLGVAEPTADSLWKKYRVNCDDQGEGGIGEVAGTGSGTPPPRLDLTKTAPRECRAGADCPLNVQARNGGDGPYPGPLSLRIQPNLAGARLASANWQCAEQGNEISCQGQPDGLAPGALTDLQLLLRIPRNAVPGSQFTSCATSAPPRAEGDPARFVQFMLTRLGFDPGGIDGRPGPNTRDAAREFQRANSLEADGVIDAELVAALAKFAGDEPSGQPACANVAIARTTVPPPSLPTPPAPSPPVVSVPPPAAPPSPPQAVPPAQPKLFGLPIPGFPKAQQPQQVVVTCTGGDVQAQQCICPPRWTRQTVRITPTAQIYNCKPPTAR